MSAKRRTHCKCVVRLFVVPLLRAVRVLSALPPSSSILHAASQRAVTRPSLLPHPVIIQLCIYALRIKARRLPASHSFEIIATLFVEVLRGHLISRGISCERRFRGTVTRRESTCADRPTCHHARGSAARSAPHCPLGRSGVNGERERLETRAVH